MKKLVKLTGKIVLLGLILLLSSCEDHKPDKCDKLKEKIKELEATIARLENCVIPGLEEPVNRVDLSIELKDFSQYYYDFFKVRKRMKAIETSDVVPLEKIKPLFLTEGIWFDYDQFKEYIAFIDKNAKEADITISGLRFFPVISQQDGKMTLVYNPTIKAENGNFSYALQKSGQEIKPVLLKDIIPNYLDIKTQQKQQKGSLMSFLNSAATDEEVQSQAGNRGQLNPPPADVIDEDA